MGLSKKFKKKLVKIAPLAAAALGPAAALTVGTAMAAPGIGKALFKGKEGPDNPFAPPDLSNLPGSAKSYFDYKSQTDSSFNDLLKQINAPSSVDQVRNEVNSDLMTQLLAGVDRDTASNVGNLKLDFQERGLGGPGQFSDIEALSLAKAREAGGETKARARGGLALDQLNLLKDRERSVQDVYNKRYAADVLGAGSAASAYNALLGEQANLQAQLYQGGESRKLAGAKPSFFEDFMKQFASGAGSGLAGVLI